LGWAGREPDLRTWLRSRGFFTGNRLKPDRPKEALEEALWAVRKPRSSALYYELAQVLGFESCVDPAFVKLHGTLRSWFGS
ncbi:MAG: hypothetical protein DMG07_06945, partial [Acidobacteria bacterium]